jgi:hypothetical protein
MQREPVTIGSYLKGKDSRTSHITVRNWLGGIFGCQHKEMSRPFSRQGETYRVCLTCGARRQFNEKTWETRGPFYFKVAQAADVASTTEIKAQKISRRPKLLKTVA